LALDLLELGYTFPSITDEIGQDGKLIGQPQVAAKLPFPFPLLSGGNAYDFARDLSTVVYARPAGPRRPVSSESEITPRP
jgi:hypothetical protein